MATSCRLVESLSSDERFSQDFFKNVEKDLFLYRLSLK
jgi:hypothetical protein